MRAIAINDFMRRCIDKLEKSQCSRMGFSIPKRTNPDEAFTDIPTTIYLGYSELDTKIEVAERYWSMNERLKVCKVEEDKDFCRQIFHTIFPKDQITFEHLNDFTRYAIEIDDIFDWSKSWCSAFFNDQLYSLPHFSLRRWQAEGGAINIIFPGKEQHNNPIYGGGRRVHT